jgi:hypothetical protein
MFKFTALITFATLLAAFTTAVNAQCANPSVRRQWNRMSNAEQMECESFLLLSFPPLLFYPALFIIGLHVSFILFVLLFSSWTPMHPIIIQSINQIISINHSMVFWMFFQGSFTIKEDVAALFWDLFLGAATKKIWVVHVRMVVQIKLVTDHQEIWTLTSIWEQTLKERMCVCDGTPLACQVKSARQLSHMLSVNRCRLLSWSPSFLLDLDFYGFFYFSFQTLFFSQFF